MSERAITSRARRSFTTLEPGERSSDYPFAYTTSRWLKHDKLQRDARYVKFDFEALCAKAVNASAGATKVVEYKKKEGGFNRAFVMSLDNGARVIARVPFRIAGPRRLTTNSEVATMAYIRSQTKTRIPKVLDCAIGTEYIIMEHAPGVQLHEKWPTMSPHQHMLCTKSVALMITEMARLTFPAYGSLYFADAPLDPTAKTHVADGFCIGPHCGVRYWDCDAREARHYEQRPPNRGPWLNLQSYCDALIDAGLSRIPQYNDALDEPSYQGSVQEHIHLLDISKRVLGELSESSVLNHVARPTLLHPDIHKRNIYVSEEDPSIVTMIIDWQSTSIEPAVVYANDTPDLVEDPAADVPILQDLMNDGSATSHALPPPVSESAEEQAAKRKHEQDILICRKTFEVVLQAYMRVLHDARAMDQTLLRPIRYCDASWRDGAAALRQELIELSQRWSELGLPGSCPYQPSPDEPTAQAGQYEDFETAQQLKLFLKRALDADSDGWVPAEEWVAAKAANRKFYAEWVASVEENGGDEERARRLWPFNEVDAS